MTPIPSIIESEVHRSSRGERAKVDESCYLAEVY
jgi:hypothetical protein